MTTQTLSITLQYDHTIGRAEFSGPGFRNPVAMARGEDDTMYVVSRSYEYRPDGKRITICTVDEDYIGEFNRPTGVAVDKDGEIYVADWNNDRLQVFNRDGNYLTQTSGEGTLSKWGTNKLDGGNPEMWEERRIAQGLDREKNFWGPIAVEVDDEGRIFVVESARSRIQIFRKQYPVFYGAGEKVAGGGGRL